MGKPLVGKAGYLVAFDRVGVLWELEFALAELPNGAQALLSVYDVVSRTAEVRDTPIELWDLVVAQDRVDKELLLASCPHRRTLVVRVGVDGVPQPEDSSKRPGLLRRFHRLRTMVYFPMLPRQDQSGAERRDLDSRGSDRVLASIDTYPVWVGSPGMSICTFGSRLASTAAHSRAILT